MGMYAKKRPHLVASVLFSILLFAGGLFFTSSTSLRQIPEHSKFSWVDVDEIISIAWSPDSTILALATEYRVFLVTYSEEQLRTSLTDSINDLLWDPISGKIIVVGLRVQSWDDTTRTEYLIDNRDIRYLEHWSGDASPDKALLAVASTGRTVEGSGVTIWNLINSDQVLFISGRSEYGTSDGILGYKKVAWTDSSGLLALTASEDKVLLWDNYQDMESFTEVATNLGLNSNFEVHRSSSQLAIISLENNQLQIIDFTSNELLLEISEHEFKTPSISWLPEGRYLTVVTKEGITTINVEDSTFATLPLKSATIVSWSPDGNVLAVGDQNGNLRLFDQHDVIE